MIDGPESLNNILVIGTYIIISSMSNRSLISFARSIPSCRYDEYERTDWSCDSACWSIRISRWNRSSRRKGSCGYLKDPHGVDVQIRHNRPEHRLGWNRARLKEFYRFWYRVTCQGCTFLCHWKGAWFLRFLETNRPEFVATREHRRFPQSYSRE